MSSSLFSRFYRWLHRELYEVSDDPHAPECFRAKTRRMLHNHVLIQVLMVLTWFAPFLFIPLILLLITIPYFIIAYCIWALVTGTAWFTLIQREKNLAKKQQSGSELAAEYSARV